MPDTPSGQITLAVLSSKLDSISEDLKAVLIKSEKDHDSVINHDNRIANLEARVNAWNLVNSIGALIAFITAVILGKS